ncbi:uncharacterized protein P884DRAFT_319153 [Thermothelomyces heterothallicus CBS 202.75]|uniref:uncharacterized protein n=1 Tax=Thermothelomyces heterothallicus CBS 202.75 TaxID=1149848 RepID=UPI003742B1CF
MSIPQRSSGHIVALEGPPELVSTQLRILPDSSKILVLPGLQYYLEDEVSKERRAFDARELIYRYHAAAQARRAEALEFLRPSTSTDETRLVFTHGGTMSAQVSCLSAIMEHETDGNIEEAHATFIRLASNGHARLSLARLSFYEEEESPLRSREAEAIPEPAPSNEGQTQQLSSWRAYAAAGDDTIEDPIIRAMRAADALDRETEFLQPSSTPEAELTVKLVDIPPSKKLPRPRAVQASDIPRVPRPPPPSHRQTGLSAEPVPGISPDSTLGTQPSSAASHRPSLRIHIPSSPITWTGEVAVGGDQSKVHHAQTPIPDAFDHRRSQTAELNLSPKQTPAPGGKIEEQATLPESGSDTLSLSKESGSVERTSAQITESKDEPFESLLPLLEDLVVFFTPETPDGLHDFVFRRLSEGYGAPRKSLSLARVSRYGFWQSESPLATMDEREIERGRSEEEDPTGVATWPRKDLVHGLPTPKNSPSSFHDTSAAVPRLDTRLYSISVGQEAAVSIQNLLRSFLGSQFPLRDRRISTADGVENSTEAGLWRPLECEAQVGSPSGERRLDLILAVGSESGVSKSRLSEVVGQLEKLGSKTSGLSRSGRLDIRYVS